MGLEDAANEVDVAFTRKEPRGLAFENVFSGVPSFLRRKLTKDLSGIDLAITGVPFDQSVTHRPGTRFGPRALREASTLQAGDPPYGWGFDPLDELAIADYGDMAFDYAKVAEVPGLIEKHARGILDQGAACLTLGGDHSITLPLLRAHFAQHGPLAFIQFDAHSDTWVDDDPARVDHGTFVYKAVKEGLIDVQKSVQIGIRVANDTPLGITRIDARAIHENGAAATARAVKDIVGDAATYLTFDIDGLDPAFAPGTGTPVWGGLSTAQTAVILRDIAGINLIGGDVVEVSPPFDHANMTAVAGAHVVHELICLWAWNRRSTSD
ncbi:agmatinase [Boseongicola aestuarii]|uniref:Agmatinase n=1 Tax=Boseongicola aestuarii TaxID=1470561 RepID=A0A238IWB3_9RHOB|nr:agmatinase [Boseongicola aestuarii]SMX22020.1 Agmatinase [Boseongicola aestuarii]